MKNVCRYLGSGRVAVELKAIEKNIDILRDYNKNKDLIVVAKNDAYNLGLESVVETCVNKGISAFAVADVIEGVRAKKVNKDVDVLILNPIDISELAIAHRFNLQLIISDFEQVKIYNECLKDMDKNNEKGSLKFHIKFNCGMNRYGRTIEELPQLLEVLEENPFVKDNVVGLMTHFPQSDEDDLSVHELQVQKFISAYELLKDNFNFKYIHSENSAAFLLKDERL